MFNLDLIPKNSRLVIGLSGGPDSVYLLHRLHELKNKHGFFLIAVHFDHEWRESSKADAAFCKKLCTELDVAFVLERASTLKKQFISNGSKEALARDMRRYVFEKTLKEYDADAVLLAHHLDDQQETFFINLIRGTSLTGLCGMASINAFYVRPMLDVPKKEILEYLEAYSIPFCVDPTNTDDAFLRNRIRSSVMPALLTCDDRAKNNLTKTMHQLQQIENFLKELTLEALSVIAAPSDGVDDDGEPIKYFNVNLETFFKLPVYMQMRSLSTWIRLEMDDCSISESFLEEVIRFLESPRGGKHQISPTWSMTKKKGIASLERNS